ncbi:MAG: formylglycine-generating enzyme family protein [Elusimicrobia bacterium]|nr:formylglycine-generating enzyme family protein [Elusimicrobiota bacterium]
MGKRFLRQKILSNLYHINPNRPETGLEHITRGGSWDFDIDSCRSANRASYSEANDDIGFRCAVSKTVVETQELQLN